VENTLKYAKLLIQENGGKVADSAVTVRLQKPMAPPLEESFPRVVPVARVSVSDNTAWTFRGNWTGNVPRVAEQAGAEVVFTFTGTGIAIQGNWSGDGGKADVYVDGAFSRTIDCWFNQPGGYSIWQTFTLKPGKHTVRLVVNGTKRDESAGIKVGVSAGVVFITGKKAYEGIDVTRMP
jgi:hypothetical protein